MPDKSVIIGATSGVGRALAEYLSSLDHTLLLCARSERDLDANRHNLTAKYGNEVISKPLDFSKNESADELTGFIAFASQKYTNIFICSGKVLEEDAIGTDKSEFESMIQTNFSTIAYFLNCVTRTYIQNDNAPLGVAVVTSVAVCRPRGSNVIYAASKAALDFYCRALQHRLWNTNISIRLIRLGYTNTSMTYGKKLPFPVAKPSVVAKKIYDNRNKNSRIIYIPWFWKPIGLLLNIFPWFIYKKLNF